jgi:hypothetical protein
MSKEMSREPSCEGRQRAFLKHARTRSIYVDGGIMRAKNAHTATCALDIEIHWLGGTLLRQEHFNPPCKYTLRDQLVDEDASLVVCREWLGAEAHELVSVSEGEVRVHGLSGTATLVAGQQTVVEIGPLSFRIRLSEPVKLPPALKRAEMDTRGPAWTAASFALHGFMLLCMALLPPKASSLSLDMLDEDARFARYLVTPVTQEEPLPWSEPMKSDAPTKSDGAHAGDEGQAGKPESAKTRGRMGVRGEQTQRVLPKLTASNAGSQGILGVLAASAPYAGATSPFGPEAPVGYDPADAMGRLFGDEIGDNFGMGGLGMRGTGRYGGGDAVGTVGVGHLGTGEAARRAPGAAVGSNLRRESRVPSVHSGPVEVRGSLSKEVIRRVIHRNLAQVRFCYEQGLAKRPDLAGRVSIQFMIAPSGAVQQAVVAHNALGSAETAECMALAVRRWNFPAPDGGGYVTVTYPFMFEQSE